MTDLLHIAKAFAPEGSPMDATPLGKGLINDTFRVTTSSPGKQYVLQRINHSIFKDVDLLQDNIVKVTGHIRKKLISRGESDIDRKVLRFLPCPDTGKTYLRDGESYWRMSVLIPDAFTFDAVTPEYSFFAGKAFGQFESMLSDLDSPLGETIPDFHNMELRLRQLQEAILENRAGRMSEEEVAEILEDMSMYADRMCLAENLHREGKLPKRVCHCDTKVNNMLFDRDGNVLCVIDLDTVMPSYVFSDYGDFLRTGACTAPEDEPDLSKVGFDMEIFRSFTKGYIEGTKEFLLPVERENLPYAACLFPYMQAVRFFTDYINGDTYYKIQYPEHNLVRTRAQMKLFHSVMDHLGEMSAFIETL